MTPTDMHAPVEQCHAHPAPVRTFDRVFPAVPAQVREARRFLAGLLDGCAVADEAITCLSELAANACLHSASALPGGTFTVRVRIGCGGQLRVEVADEGGPWVTGLREDEWPHGLAIVASLAADSGVCGDAVTGWTSWVAFSCPCQNAMPD